MKSFLLILAILFPLCAFAQIDYTLGGTVTTSNYGVIIIPPGSTQSGQFTGASVPSGYTLSSYPYSVVSYYVAWFGGDQFSPAGFYVFEKSQRPGYSPQISLYSSVGTYSFTVNTPPSTDQTVTIEGSFMSPEQWEAAKITSANLQLWVKFDGGEWQMVSEIESSDGSYSLEFESESSFDYEIRLGDYVIDLGDTLPSVTLPGGEVLGNGTYTQPTSNLPPTVSISSNGTTSLGGSSPVQSGSTVTLPSSPGGSPSVQPIYTVPGTNGTTHYVNTGTGQVTSYSSGSPSAGTQNAVAQQNLSDIVGSASFPSISGNYTVPSVPDGLGQETVSQGQAIATMAESARGGLVSAIGSVPSPNMPSFGSALSWSATIPYLGAISFDLSPHSGIINAWREFLKFLLAILAWIWTIQIIRGSTA